MGIRPRNRRAKPAGDCGLHAGARRGAARWKAIRATEHCALSNARTSLAAPFSLPYLREQPCRYYDCSVQRDNHPTTRGLQTTRFTSAHLRRRAIAFQLHGPARDSAVNRQRQWPFPEGADGWRPKFLELRERRAPLFRSSEHRMVCSTWPRVASGRFRHRRSFRQRRRVVETETTRPSG
jgi:hypothetical protein